MHRMSAPTQAFSSVDRFREGVIQSVPDFGGGEFGESRLEIDHHVIRRRSAVGLSVVLPNHPSGPITLHRTAHFRRCGNSKPPPALRGGDGDTHEGRSASGAGLQESGELVALLNPPVPSEPSACGLLWLGVQSSCEGPAWSQAPRRWRPLARRLLITSLPPRDLMRTRKPCVLLLRRLLG